MEGGIEGEKKKKKRKLGPDGEIIVKKRGWVIKWFLIKKMKLWYHSLMSLCECNDVF